MPTTWQASGAVRLFPWLAGAGLVAFAAHAVFGIGGAFFDDWLYNALVLSGAGACLLRAAWVREERMAWLLLGAGLASWSAGEIVWTVAYSGDPSPPYPSAADPLYLAFYPASYAALVLLVKARVREFRPSLWLDGVVGALAVTAAGAALFFDPILEATGGTAPQIAVNLAYPLLDALLVVMVVAVFALTGWRPGASWLMLGAGLAINAVADSLYLYQDATGAYVEGGPLDVLWPAAALLIGFAAWQPSLPWARVRLHGARMLVAPSVGAALAVGLLVYGQFRPLHWTAVVLAGAALLAAILRMALTFRENLSILDASRRQALTDELTGLGNRRRLMVDLQEELDALSVRDPQLLVYFDLDGFKRYNDAFGHPAGDALLTRLGQNLAAVIEPQGRAYRLGGDEFCVLVPLDGTRAERVTAGCSAALTDHGEGFTIGSSYGAVILPQEAATTATALLIADQRMYAQKGSGRASAVQQTHDVLIGALREREPELGDHLNDVGELAHRVGRRMGLLPERLDELVRAAELHDIGKIAVPDAILRDPGPLQEADWAFVRQHTIIGERILSAAPALIPVAKLVRASHEAFDGSGYPDGMAGAEIPLGARIIAACDAYHAMTNDRVYQSAIGPAAALAELRRCAGAQFDPGVVLALCEELEAPAPADPAQAGPLRQPRAQEPEPTV